MIQSFLCIPHIPVGYAGGRAPTVGALGDAGAVAETRRTRSLYFSSCSSCLRGVFLWFTSRQLFISPMLNNIVNHGRIGQRGGIAQTADLIGRHFTQNTTHDFTGPGFG